MPGRGLSYCPTVRLLLTPRENYKAFNERNIINFLIMKGESIMEENRMEGMAMDLVEVESGEESGRTGLGTGLAMLIGSGLTLAAVVGVRKARKAWKNHKAKKAEEYVEEDFDEEDAVDTEYEEVEEEPRKEKK